jgi:hypothetical protein
MPAGSCVLLNLLVNRLKADFSFARVSMQSKRYSAERSIPRAARAASGHAATAPPSSVMKSRRAMQAVI